MTKIYGTRAPEFLSHFGTTAEVAMLSALYPSSSDFGTTQMVVDYHLVA